MARPPIYLARFCGGFLLVLLCGTVALGQAAPTKIIKTQPSRASDIVTIPLTIHFLPGTAPNPPWGGWAGTRIKIHIADDSEVDPTGSSYVPPPGTAPPSVGGPLAKASSNIFYTFWNPGPVSGITPAASQPLPVGNLVLHVGNSNPIGNSDVDLTVMYWNIYHLRERPGSSLITLHGSDYMLVRSSIPFTIPNPSNPTAPIPFQHNVGIPNRPDSSYELPNPPSPTEPNLHWAHFLDTVVFHNPGGPGSQYFAFMSTAILGVGIEHVPEPAAAMLAASGLASMGLSWILRRRRNRTA